MIGSDYYEAYLYAKNNISQAEADKGRKTDNNELFQLDKLAYTLGIIGINITDDSNLITFVTSKTVNSNYVFNYFIVDLTFGENNIDFSYCDEFGNYCKVSEEGRWLQVYSFQNIEKLNRYYNVNVN
ncbi:hypothetical protein KO527_22395 [Pseudoalteromonas sp. C2R02]|uniref:hypothetical protein n=1 Tax=Pseudoalteromonas sp. C2R02 TaxID=2841565 RepID=UPI001C082498|nr:hypothetical protein [Pseudoalteromonas sp. C2R02]MBU2972091.1 hypothetical protein [Pseudoalteromonas sp. C2R02]